MAKQNIYFVGIGGIGMSALARYFKHEGYNVAGYDRTPSALTHALEGEGIVVCYNDHESEIPPAFRTAATTTVIYTPAIPADSPQMGWFGSYGFEILKRSAILGLLGAGKRVMAVAGTHGKTTTTTMLAHFNTVAAGEGSAFLGGISRNFHSNLVQGPGDRLAVEADEFDRSFLQLYPQEALITSCDADHLDIYGSYDKVVEAFETFAGQMKSNGTLIVKKGVAINTPRADVRRYTYHCTDSAADFHARNIRVDATGHYTFDIVTPTEVIVECRLGIPGLINVENCIGAVSLLAQEGYDADALRSAIASFSGVERRFQFWINTPELVYMDDYAHHPAELSAMLGSVRGMFPGRHITILFQPHLYTRTRDFAPEFAEALSIADTVMLLDIYPAREEPIEGVDSQMILGAVTSAHTEIALKEQVVERLAQMPLDILITAGAGDIDRLCAPIAAMLQQKLR